MDRYIWYSTPGQQFHPAAEELLSYKAEGLGDLCFAGRRIGTVKAMSFSGSTQDAPQENRRPDPPLLVIDEVGPPHSSAPGPTPRFAQLSCLRRQRSR
jgi:hypothetical protein